MKVRRASILYLILLWQSLSCSLTQAYVSSSSSSRGTTHDRPLSPPFPNGPCGGSVITIPPEETFGKDTRVNTFVLPPRDTLVWLPPDYDKEAAHPILLCHDGQNAMDDTSSWTGASWRMMGAITRLSERHLFATQTPVVVLLPSCDGDLVPGLLRRRHLEYGGFFAEEHCRFVVDTILPLIRERFCGHSQQQQAYAIGTSLGGQVSLLLLVKYPHLFAGAACLSPAFQMDSFLGVLAEAPQLRDKRLYLDIGGDTDEVKVKMVDVWDHLTPKHWWNPGYWWLDSQLQPSVQLMRLALDVTGIEYEFHQEPGGRHNERAWSQRIDKPLLHLFGKKPTTTTRSKPRR